MTEADMLPTQSRKKQYISSNKMHKKLLSDNVLIQKVRKVVF